MTRSPEPTRRPRERVFTCGVILGDQPLEREGPLHEIRMLLEAAGAEVVGEPIVQRRDRPVAATLLGRGKVTEVREALAAAGGNAVAVDNDLSPAQVRNLESALGVRVIDRSEVILDIFARRAMTRQASLQVELAQEEYLLPRLRRMWTHLERTEGAIGTRGPGETQLETDRRLLRKRIRDLKAELAEIEARRQREVRSRESVFTVGLVGYTNAGKSTLMNRLTGANVLVADMLFATLDTRTRKWRLPDGRTVLLSDTVGFLQRLPHHLVASFHATLEQTLRADLLLHVVDASHPDADRQIEAVDLVLDGLSASTRADVLVWNKIDRLESPRALPYFEGRRGIEVVAVSAVTGAGLDRLTQVVADRLDARSPVVDITLPVSDGKLIAAVKSAGAVCEEEFLGHESVRLRVRVPESALGGLLRRADGSEATFCVVEPARESLAASDPFLDAETSSRQRTRGVQS